MFVEKEPPTLLEAPGCFSDTDVYLEYAERFRGPDAWCDLPYLRMH